MTNVRLLCLPLIAMLGACGSGASDAERKTAAGEVLGGSISDEMLPLDTVTSESPPLREKADGGSANKSGGDPSRSETETDTETAPAVEATPEPAAEPSAEPTSEAPAAG